MSNYSVDDIHRSLRRYVSQALGSPPWTVRTERQPVEDDARNVCVVEPASPSSQGKHRVSIPQGNLEKMMAFSAMAYPELGDTAADSRLAAQLVADLLEQAFAIGLVEGKGEEQRNIGGPFRLPVYDFAGVPVKGAERGAAGDEYGFAWVDDLTVRPLQDPIDYLRFTVVCDVRLSWEQGGRLLPGAPAAGSMSGTFEPPSP